MEATQPGGIGENARLFFAWLDGSEVYQKLVQTLSKNPLNSFNSLGELPRIMARLCAAKLGEDEVSSQDRRICIRHSIELLIWTIECGGLTSCAYKDAELIATLKGPLEPDFEEVTLSEQLAQQLEFHGIWANRKQKRLLMNIVEKI